MWSDSGLCEQCLFCISPTIWTESLTQGKVQGTGDQVNGSPYGNQISPQAVNISRGPSNLFGRGDNQKEGYSFLMIWDETRTNDAHSLNDLIRGDQSYTITYNGLIGSYKLSRVVIDPHLDGRLSPREPRVNATSLRAKERWLRETGGIRLVIAVISTAVLWTRGCQGLQTLIQRQIL